MAKSLYCLHSRRFGFRLSLQSKIFSIGGKIMKLKRFAIILLAVAIFASVLAVSASAAEIQPYNNVDQAYSFNFNGSWWQDDLHQYWKENSTSVYIYSKVFPGRYNIYTNGYVNGSWGDYTMRGSWMLPLSDWIPHRSPPTPDTIIRSHLQRTSFQRRILRNVTATVRWAFIPLQISIMNADTSFTGAIRVTS